MTKERVFNNRKSANFFFYGITKKASQASVSYNTEKKGFVVTWVWDKEAFKKNKNK